MKNEIVKNKVKIFISSRESGLDADGQAIVYERYRYVRRAIKELLEETNMAQVYVRELEETAGTLPIKNEYLNALRDQDICIFIIDNCDDEDGHAQGVVNEYEAAKDQYKKMMFVFCVEFSKNETPIAKEMKNSSGPTCLTAQTFDEIPTLVYRSVINDIIKIYRNYCYPHSPEQNMNLNFKESMNTPQFMLNSQSNAPEIVLNRKSKEINLIDYPILKNEMNSLTGTRETTSAGDPFDILCANLFSFIMFKNDYNAEKIKAFEEEILKFHDKAYHEVIKAKISSFRCYLSGDIEKCYVLLQEAYTKAKKISSFPNWMLLDILIDLRNLRITLDNESNTCTYENEWQKELSSNSETVYYPVLDRYVEEHFERIEKFLREHEMDSPYTIHFENQGNTLFENCFAAFVVAVSNVSITQMLCVRKRLVATFSAICRVYNAPNQFVELMRLLIIEKRNKDVKEHIDVLGYAQNISAFNAYDAKNILDAVRRIPQKKHRANSAIILFHYFGYYFSDEDYTSISEMINAIIGDFLRGEKYTTNLINDMTKAISENIRRINLNYIVDYIIHFTKFDTPHSNRATELLNTKYFEHIDEAYKKKLVDAYIESSKREDNKEISTILHGLIYLRRLYPKYATIIDEAVLKNNENYYRSDYDLEVSLSEQKGEAIDYQIDRFIDEAISQNKQRGKNDVYCSNDREPLVVLANIIQLYSESISGNKITEIVNVAKETLTEDTQTISSKICAVQLLLQLCNYCAYKPSNEMQQLLIGNRESMLLGWEDGLFNKDTKALLSFNLTVLKMRFFENPSSDFIAAISQSNISDYNYIKMAKAINTFCNKNDWTGASSETLLSIFHFSIAGCGHKNYEVRLLSCRTLFELLRSDYNALVSEQLSIIMDNADWILAQDIVYHISKANNIDKSLKDFVLQKALSSNHFVVKEMAHEVLSHE